jgi:hypothetical protein
VPARLNHWFGPRPRHELPYKPYLCAAAPRAVPSVLSAGPPCVAPTVRWLLAAQRAFLHPVRLTATCKSPHTNPIRPRRSQYRKTPPPGRTSARTIPRPSCCASWPVFVSRIGETASGPIITTPLTCTLTSVRQPMRSRFGCQATNSTKAYGLCPRTQYVGIQPTIPPVHRRLMIVPMFVLMSNRP